MTRMNDLWERSQRPLRSHHYGDRDTDIRKAETQ
jgi:hypothetical protein